MEITFGFDLSDIIEEIKKKTGKVPIRAERNGAHSVKLWFKEDLTDEELNEVKAVVSQFAPQLKLKNVTTTEEKTK
jgi:hypothetical protein